MKRKTELIIGIGKIFASCLAFALCFIKIFHEVAVLPGVDSDGNDITGRFDYYYSVYDKFSRENLLPLLGFTLAFLLAGAILPVLDLVIKDKKVLKIMGSVTVAVALVLFLATIIVANFIWYAY